MSEPIQDGDRGVPLPGGGSLGDVHEQVNQVDHLQGDGTCLDPGADETTRETGLPTTSPRRDGPGARESMTRVVISRFLNPDERLQEELRIKARKELGPWIQTFTWDHFTTLTFKHSQTETTARTHFTRWIRRLEQQAQRSVGWVQALERGAAGRLHFHVLTVGTDQLAPRAIEIAWRCGRADASRYDPGKGAARYLTKDVGADTLDLTYDIAPPSKLSRAAPVPHMAPIRSPQAAMLASIEGLTNQKRRRGSPTNGQRSLGPRD